MSKSTSDNPHQQTSGGFLSARHVRQRYDISDMTLYRWTKDSAMAFPQPMIINTKRYWSVAELVAWERGQKAA